MQNHSAGVTWDAENPAPEQASTDGVGVGISKSAAGHILPMAHASLVGPILVGFILSACLPKAKGGRGYLRQLRYRPRTV